MGITEETLTRATKPLTKSVTIWGAVATVVVSVLAVLGWDVEEATIQQILEAGAIVVGGIITIIGRIRATKDIAGLKSLLLLALSALLLVGLMGGPAVAGERKFAEKAYQKQWCRERGGIMEYVLPDLARVDCLLPDMAVEVDFASKWAEAAGQSLYYASKTGRKAGVLLIMENPVKDRVYLGRLMSLIREQGLPIQVFLIEPGDIRQ